MFFDKYGVSTYIGDQVWIRGSVVSLPCRIDDEGIVTLDIGSELVDVDTANIERHTKLWQINLVWNDARYPSRRFMDFYLSKYEQTLSMKFWKLSLHIGRY